ncbi:MAG: UDP-N-acetylmuramoyl-L-alanine--D-glutamate ligase, partial [Clostridia bacterium]|nr:UDP-N-acetylmuramoyl-L-alanine--D-glutamate ligase [Clostridia bacterium]
LLNLRESEYAVLNYDDDIVSSFSDKTRANVVWFSTKEKVDGAYLTGTALIYDDEVIIKTTDLNLSGEHNISDVLACICILKLCGLTTTEIHNALKTFKGVKHRIELIHEKNEISFYNDSKATNVDATIKAINSMQKPTVLILGGYDKGLNYTELMSAVKNCENVKKVVLTGASSKAMFDSAIKVGLGEVSVIKEFSLAVRVAYRLAEKGWNVLLSPSTSSFDEFSGFEERGERFVEIVTSL